MKLSRRRYLALGVATLMSAIVVVASSITATALRSEVNEAKAMAQTEEKKQQEKKQPEENKKPEGKIKEKAEEKNVPRAGSILLGLVVGVLFVGGGLLAYGRVSYGSASEDGSFVGAVRRVVFRPVGFFAGLSRNGNVAAPLLFALICIEISAVLAWLLVLIGVGLGPGVNPNPQNLGVPSVFAPNSPIASVILAPIGGAIGIFIAAAIQQLLVRLVVGARNSGFSATFRVASYTQVTSLVNWIPIIGPLLALYGIYLSIVGIREMHGTTTGKAVLVIVIPFVVALVVLAILLAVGIALFAQG